jgi:hypothetical protein
MPKLDPFTRQRITKFVENFRAESGQLPTLKDLASAGISKELVKSAISDELLSEFYVTLTNGTIVKAYKIAP